MNYNNQNNEQNCFSCMFYSHELCSCQRMPPVPYVTEKDGKPFVISYFPRVNASWCWCGEYRPVKHKN